MMIKAWKDLMIRGLEEDNVSFDWSARSILKTHTTAKTVDATLVAKATGVWAGEAGLKSVEVLSAEMGSPLKVTYHKKNGDTVKPKDKIATLHGASDAVVGFERTLINIIAYASGIATQTRALVDKVNSKGLKNPPRITGTRKTLPAYKEVAIESTLLGGAHPHRYNLSGGLLLKENHVAAHGGIAAAVAAARKIAPHLLKIEIEVRNMDELKQAIDAGAEVIMLDNFTPDQVKQAIAIKPKSSVVFEVSGGLNIDNIDPYIIEGLDVISIGSITHSVKSLDISLLMDSLI